ncbi:alpha/beta hydrolase [Ectopseudomonas alcaliphila]|uniref:alpha/beta hydrolase n=1 Tax=Ectopseudomonas alcaliphila TaxID=101564 RepID=UPI00373FCCEA
MRRPCRPARRCVLVASSLRALALLLASLWLAGCSGLLFYPEPGLPITPDRAGLEYRDIELYAADGTRLHAWWLPAKAGVHVKGTVLHLHGNGGNLAWHLGGVHWLPEQGYQVLMLDYRGYGLSEGKPRLPEVYQDIDAAFAWLDQAPQVEGAPLFLLGQSLGGALAVHYLAEHPERQSALQAIALDGVPASYRDVARYALSKSWLTWPLQVPLSWLVPEGDSAIHSIDRLEGVPLLIYHSIDDTIVPLSNGQRLYQAARPPRAFQATRGPHVQTFSESAWRQSLLAFFVAPQAYVERLGPATESATESPQ